MSVDFMFRDYSHTVLQAIDYAVARFQSFYVRLFNLTAWLSCHSCFLKAKLVLQKSDRMTY